MFSRQQQHHHQQQAPTTDKLTRKLNSRRNIKGVTQLCEPDSSSSSIASWNTKTTVSTASTSQSDSARTTNDTHNDSRHRRLSLLSDTSSNNGSSSHHRRLNLLSDTNSNNGSSHRRRSSLLSDTSSNNGSSHRRYHQIPVNDTGSINGSSHRHQYSTVRGQLRRGVESMNNEQRQSSSLTVANVERYANSSSFAREMNGCVDELLSSSVVNSNSSTEVTDNRTLSSSNGVGIVKRRRSVDDNVVLYNSASQNIRDNINIKLMKGRSASVQRSCMSRSLNGPENGYNSTNIATTKSPRKKKGGLEKVLKRSSSKDVSTPVGSTSRSVGSRNSRCSRGSSGSGDSGSRQSRSTASVQSCPANMSQRVFEQPPQQHNYQGQYQPQIRTNTSGGTPLHARKQQQYSSQQQYVFARQQGIVSSVDQVNENKSQHLVQKQHYLPVQKQVSGQTQQDSMLFNQDQRIQQNNAPPIRQQQQISAQQMSALATQPKQIKNQTQLRQLSSPHQINKNLNQKSVRELSSQQQESTCQPQDMLSQQDCSKERDDTGIVSQQLLPEPKQKHMVVCSTHIHEASHNNATQQRQLVSSQQKESVQARQQEDDRVQNSNVSFVRQQQQIPGLQEATLSSQPQMDSMMRVNENQLPQQTAHPIMTVKTHQRQHCTMSSFDYDRRSRINENAQKQATGQQHRLPIQHQKSVQPGPQHMRFNQDHSNAHSKTMAVAEQLQQDQGLVASINQDNIAETAQRPLNDTVVLAQHQQPTPQHDAVMAGPHQPEEEQEFDRRHSISFSGGQKTSIAHQAQLHCHVEEEEFPSECGDKIENTVATESENFITIAGGNVHDQQQQIQKGTDEKGAVCNNIQKVEKEEVKSLPREAEESKLQSCDKDNTIESNERRVSGSSSDLNAPALETDLPLEERRQESVQKHSSLPREAEESKSQSCDKDNTIKSNERRISGSFSDLNALMLETGLSHEERIQESDQKHNSAPAALVYDEERLSTPAISKVLSAHSSADSESSKVGSCCQREETTFCQGKGENDASNCGQEGSRLETDVVAIHSGATEGDLDRGVSNDPLQAPNTVQMDSKVEVRFNQSLPDHLDASATLLENNNGEHTVQIHDHQRNSSVSSMLSALPFDQGERNCVQQQQCKQWHNSAPAVLVGGENIPGSEVNRNINHYENAIGLPTGSNIEQSSGGKVRQQGGDPTAYPPNNYSIRPGERHSRNHDRLKEVFRDSTEKILFNTSKIVQKTRVQDNNRKVKFAQDPANNKSSNIHLAPIQISKPQVTSRPSSARPGQKAPTTLLRKNDTTSAPNQISKHCQENKSPKRMETQPTIRHLKDYKHGVSGYMVTIPEGACPGQQFPVHVNGHQPMMVTCPQGAVPGKEVRILLPTPQEQRFVGKRSQRQPQPNVGGSKTKGSLRQLQRGPSSHQVRLNKYNHNNISHQAGDRQNVKAEFRQINGSVVSRGGASANTQNKPRPIMPHARSSRIPNKANLYELQVPDSQQCKHEQSWGGSMNHSSSKAAIPLPGDHHDKPAKKRSSMIKKVFGGKKKQQQQQQRERPEPPPAAPQPSATEMRLAIAHSAFASMDIKR